MYWKKKILPKLRRKIATCKNRNIKAYFKYCLGKWKILAVGDVAALRNLETTLSEMLSGCTDGIGQEDILETFGYQSFCNEKVNEGKIKQAVASVSEFNSTHRGAALKNIKWSPYVLMYLLSTRTCPYCNRQYITPLCIDEVDGNDSKKMRADLDHFWPKSKYPHFSMSLYNLVPSCKFCNSSLKGPREFAFDTLNPYECHYDDYFHFDIDLGDFDFDSLRIETVLDNPKIQPILEMFAIKELYAYHDNIAREFVQKKLCYPDAFLEALLRQFEERNCYGSLDELKSVLLGFPASKSKIDDEPLGKLRYDLADAMGFL